MFVPKIEQFIGIETYATRSSGIGGALRRSIEDFRVEEVLADGSKAETILSDAFGKRQVLGSSTVRDRYLLCVLVKRNWDTFTAVRNVAAQLGKAVNQVHFAGIKDTKAVTAQHIAIEDASIEEVRKIRIKDVEVRPIGYSNKKLSAYYMLGNSFRIGISALNHSESVIRKRVVNTINELQRSHGAPNFFGHQRFGTTRPVTHSVGKALVKGDLRAAAMLFLAKPFEAEHPESRQAREELQNDQDFRRALKSFPKQLRYERLMLRHLVESPDDFAGAFRRLPLRLRELLPQACQSYLFNKFLSKRIAGRIGVDKAEVGDYVVNVERCGLPMVRSGRVVKSAGLSEINCAIKDGRMRIALPLIGFKQLTSQGVQGDMEKHVLEEEGVSPDDFRIDGLAEISSRGELRAAVVPINEFMLRGVSRDPTSGGKRRAELGFALYRGSYATIVLREIMKPRNPLKAGY